MVTEVFPDVFERRVTYKDNAYTFRMRYTTGCVWAVTVLCDQSPEHPLLVECVEGRELRTMRLSAGEYLDILVDRTMDKWDSPQRLFEKALITRFA